MDPRGFYTALLIDALAFLSALALSKGAAAFLTLSALHALAASQFALALLPALPQHYRQQKLAALGLLFILAFMAPVIGPIVTVIILRFSLLRHGRHDAAVITVAEPQLEGELSMPMPTGRGGLRARLSPDVPLPQRIRTLLSLQELSGRVGNPILESLLSDEHDEIRLIAFGMLDAREKVLAQSIAQMKAQLQAATHDEQRYRIMRSLAELHWEMVYSGLTRGELAQTMLELARLEVENVRAQPGADEDAALWRLDGLIHMRLGELSKPRESFANSLALGMPPAAVLPYLAEIAFAEGDLATVRQLMGQLASFQQLSPVLRSRVAFWLGAGREHAPTGRYHLPHL